MKTNNQELYPASSHFCSTIYSSERFSYAILLDSEKELLSQVHRD